MKKLISKKLIRVTLDFYETIECFDDGSIESVVYYRKEAWGFK